MVRIWGKCLLHRRFASLFNDDVYDATAPNLPPLGLSQQLSSFVFHMRVPLCYCHYTPTEALQKRP